jgi:hypothetical protein
MLLHIGRMTITGFIAIVAVDPGATHAPGIGRNG